MKKKTFTLELSSGSVTLTSEFPGRRLYKYGYYQEPEGSSFEANYDISEVSCCGLRDFHDLSELGNVYAKCTLDQKRQVVVHLREDLHRGAGAAFATTIPSQKSAAVMLEAVGFKKVDTFNNPNTKATVTFWFYKHIRTRKRKKP